MFVFAKSGSPARRRPGKLPVSEHLLRASCKLSVSKQEYCCRSVCMVVQWRGLARTLIPSIRQLTVASWSLQPTGNPSITIPILIDGYVIPICFCHDNRPPKCWHCNKGRIYKPGRNNLTALLIVFLSNHLLRSPP